MTELSVVEPDFAKEREIMAKTWANRPGLIGWLCETGHKELGLRYIVTAFLFFLAGGIEAALMRIQLLKPENHFLGPDAYNQLFSVHGSTMMFLFAVPIMEGFGVYLVPLMLGTHNVAFPKLNAFGYYIYLFGGLFLYVMYFLGAGPDAGWFSYVPLSGPQFSPGKGVDTWAQMITFTELSGLVVAVELVVTAFKQRCPGMSLNRIPLFVWSMIVVSFMIIFAMPAMMIASGYLSLDRLVGTHFYNRSEGGDPLFYQHMFWFFGHPEVYIIFIPGLGFVSSILTAFTGRRIFGYTMMVSTLVVTAFLGFSVWVHHMFATGLPQLGESFFTAASLMIVVPTSVQIFCWIATIWSGRLRIATPVMYVIGFFLVFIVGGLTGVMLAAIPIDWQVHDTYFVVAHLHYVLIGGALFPLFGAFHFWFPKWTGRMYSETMGQISFWLLLIGFNVTFFPMHILGLFGMPRRVYTYQPGMGWGNLNQLASIGAVFMAFSVMTMIINFLVSRRSGAEAGANPWNGVVAAVAAAALQLPACTDRQRPQCSLGCRARSTLRHRDALRPARDPRHQSARRRARSHGDAARAFALAVHPGLYVLSRTVGRDLLRLVVQHRRGFERHRPHRLVLAERTGARGSHSPRERRVGRPLDGDAGAGAGGDAVTQRVLDVSALTEGTADSRALIWWGNLGMLAIEGTMFAMAMATYLYLRSTNLDWPPGTVPKPDLTMPTINTGCCF